MTAFYYWPSLSPLCLSLSVSSLSPLCLLSVSLCLSPLCLSLCLSLCLLVSQLLSLCLSVSARLTSTATPSISAITANSDCSSPTPPPPQMSPSRMLTSVCLPLYPSSVQIPLSCFSTPRSSSRRGATRTPTS